MKNINFSPLARIGPSKNVRRIFLFLFEGLVFFIFLAVILWHRSLDTRQDQIPSSKPFKKSVYTHTNGDIDMPTQPRYRGRDEKKILNRGSGIQIQEEGAAENTDIAEREKKNPEKGGCEVDQEQKSPDASYYLKVFSGVMRKDVEKVADYLARKHFVPRIIRESGFSSMNNVYIHLDTSLSVKEMLDRLKREGFSGYVPEKAKESGPIRISSCYYRKSAERIVENLKSKGFFGNIVEENTAIKMYSLYVGEYNDIKAVVEAQKRLISMGFTIIITTDLPS